MARIVLFMCACVFKNIIYLGAHFTQLCLCLFCLLSAGKGGSSGRCARLLLRATPLRPESGICRFRGNSSNRNHSATGSLSMRTWVFLQTRISVPVPPPRRQWSQRGRAPTACFAFSDNFAGRLDELLRIILAGICRNGSRGRLASCCRQETTPNISGYSDAQHAHHLNHQNTK